MAEGLLDVTIYQCPCYAEHEKCVDVETLKQQISECKCQCHQPRKIEFRVYGKPGPNKVKLYYDDF